MYRFFIFCGIITQLSAQTPENLGEAINSEHTEIQPVISPDGKTLYFSRVSHPQNGSTKKGSQDVWFAENSSGYWTTARRMPSPVNGEENNVLYSITPDGNTVLTHWVQKDGEDLSVRGFATMKKLAPGWSRPQKLDIPSLENMNRGYYQYGFLANDGKTLLMAFSEKKNSKTSDLYISFQDKTGKWSRPEDLGDLNTNADETTPFLAADGQRIYFSSNRDGGIGSNDIWTARRLDKTWQNWSKPENLGNTINTPEFDAYFTIPASGQFAYFVTSKGGKGKGDLSRVKFLADPIEPAVVPPTIAQTTEKAPVTSEKPEVTKPTAPKADTRKAEAVVLLTGKLIDAKTQKVPANARIVYESLPDGTELGTATPDPVTGIYKIVLPFGKKYGIRPEVDGYVGKSQNLDLSQVGGYLELSDRNLTVTPIEKGATVALNNVFFEYGKATLRSESFPELNRVAELMAQRKALVIEIGGHTDNVGSDASNLKLSEARAEAVQAYLLTKNLPANRVVAKGYGETKPVAENDTDENRQQNRRVEFIILKN